MGGSAFKTASSLFKTGNVLFGVEYFNPLNWNYCKAITIDHTKVSGDQVDFPVLISLTGLSGVGINGCDIRFTSSNGYELLPREIESYSGGSLLAWVKIPNLSSLADTVIYMYYGNASSVEPAAGSTYGSAGVWYNGFGAVYHFGGSSNLSVNDSTVNAINGTNTSCTLGTGKIDGGSTFDGINSLITLPSCPLSSFDRFTISAWVKSSNIAYLSASLRQSWLDLTLNGNNKLRFSLANDAANGGPGNGGLQQSILYQGTYMPVTSVAEYVENGTWVHVTHVFNAGVSTVYVNGVAISTSVLVPVFGLGTANIIGARAVGAALWYGGIDELRISNVVRSSGWTLTTYNNMNNPASFYSVM